MNGPPTPPLDDLPEGDKNLEQPDPMQAPLDELPQAEHPPPQDPPPQDPNPENTIYHNIFPTLVSFAADRDYKSLINLAEYHDMNCDNETEDSRFLFITPLVLTYLILDDLPPARYVLTRLPNSLFVHPISQALLGLLAATWNRNHSEVYLRSSILLNLINDAPHLSGMVPSMISTFLDAFRTRTINLISKAYTSLTLTQAETYLGLPQEQLLSECNWGYDPIQKILTPARTQQSTTKRVQGSVSAPSTLFTFDFVANGIAVLES